ncbi:hypothetical protein Tco_0955202 [Tanacetum coccineum]|uniref:Uncharacterized protein n=1 Tax=Tanacetum coccineum TaxID=301880 RepID=A0ABQ5E6H9_9ASTR
MTEKEMKLLKQQYSVSIDLAAEAQENVAKVQEKILEEDIDKMVDGNDEDSYAIVDDDDVNDNVDKEKKDDEKNVDDDVEKGKKDEENDDDDEDDDNDDHDDYALVINKVLGSLETRNAQTQTPIPSPPRSPRNDLSSDKTVSEELMANVSPTANTTSKDPSMSQPISSTSKILPGSVAELSRRHGQLRKQLTDTFITKEYFDNKMKEMSNTLNYLVLELTIDKINELMKEAIPRMVNDAVKKDREIFANAVPELVLKEFATHAPKIIEELFKHHMKNKMKTDLKAQAADSEMWDVLKKKFKKSSASASSGKVHDTHQGK